MRSISRVFYLFLLSLAALLVCSSIFQIDASADILTVVDLTKEQTLALYGTTISGSYYTGSEWRACSFDYFADSSEFSTGDYITYVSDLHDTGYTSEQVTSLLRENQFLFYRCEVPQPSPSTGDLQFDLTFNVDISGIAYYRQIIGCAVKRAIYSNLDQSDFPLVNSFYTSNVVSYSAVPVVFGGKGQSAGRYFGSFKTYIAPYYTDSDYGDLINPYREARFIFSDVYLQDLDSETGLESTFSISSQSFTFSKADQYVLESSPNDGYVKAYYVIALSTPRVTDGYVLPEPPTPEPDIPGQLTDIQTSIDASNTQLALILAKLDQIYNVSIAPTINISSGSQSSLISGIVNGIRDLFLPSQADILNFRFQLYNELYSLVPAMFSAESSISDIYDSFHNVQPVSSITFPGVSVDLPDYDGNSVTFSIANQSVDLKPESSRLSVLYDALALIVDLIATVSFFNMLRNRFQKQMESG